MATTKKGRQLFGKKVHPETKSQQVDANQVERAHRESGWRRLSSHSCLCTIRRTSLHHRRLVVRTSNVQGLYLLLTLLYRFILVSILVAYPERRWATSSCHAFTMPPFLVDYCIHTCVVSLGAFFFNGPGPGPAVLFRGPSRPGRPKVGPAIEFGRYRPRPPPALFVFANGVGKRFVR